MSIRNIGRDLDFQFDHVFGDNCTQEQIFDSVKHVVEGVMEGFNGSLLAYGQVSSVTRVASSLVVHTVSQWPSRESGNVADSFSSRL